MATVQTLSCEGAENVEKHLACSFRSVAFVFLSSATEESHGDSCDDGQWNQPPDPDLKIESRRKRNQDRVNLRTYRVAEWFEYRTGGYSFGRVLRQQNISSTSEQSGERQNLMSLVVNGQWKQGQIDFL